MKTFLLLCYIVLSYCNPISDSDFVDIDVSDFHGHNIFKRGASEDDQPPCEQAEELSLPLKYKQYKKTLQLKLNKELSLDNIPVIVPDAVGFLKKRKPKRKQKVSALYDYEEEGYRYGIMVTCSYKPDCSPQGCKIREDLLSEDDLIDILGSVEDKRKKLESMNESVPFKVRYSDFIEETMSKSGPDVRIPGMNKKGVRDDRLPPLRDQSKKIRREDLLSEKARKKLEREEEFMRKKAKENKRTKRATQPIYANNEYVINLLMTNDAEFFRIFKTWDGGVYTDDEAFLLMEEFILFAVGGMDHRMYNIRNLHPDVKIRVHLSGIMPVFEDQLSTDLHQWTVHTAGLIPNGLDANEAIDNFSLFVEDNGYLMFGVDHVMAITGQDLSIEVSDNVWDSSMKGYTFVNSMCNNPLYSISIVEFPAQGYVYRYASHELAHSMGIFHDEGGAGCAPSEQFIMTDNLKPATMAYASNPFLFSSCSVAKLKEFLARTQNNNEGLDPSLQCLTNGGVPDYEGLLQYRMAGKHYKIRTQCVYLMNDMTSIVCMPPHASYCYHAIYCTAAWDPGYCHTGYAYNGSPCNNLGQICYEGHCVDEPTTKSKPTTEEITTTTTQPTTTEKPTTTTEVETTTTTEKPPTTTTEKVETTTTTEKPTTTTEKLETTTTTEKPTTTTEKVETTTTTEKPTTTEKVETTTTTEKPTTTTEKVETTEKPTTTTKKVETTTRTTTVSTTEATTTTSQATTTTTQKTTPEKSHGKPDRTGEWSEWTLCNRKCSRKRSRFCPVGDTTCKGKQKEEENCTGGMCPVKKRRKRDLLKELRQP